VELEKVVATRVIREPSRVGADRGLGTRAPV
jgi:hypothetical protein